MYLTERTFHLKSNHHRHFLSLVQLFQLFDLVNYSTQAFHARQAALTSITSQCSHYSGLDMHQTNCSLHCTDRRAIAIDVSPMAIYNTSCARRLSTVFRFRFEYSLVREIYSLVTLHTRIYN